MPTSNVLILDDLRVRREQRLQRTLALHRTDAERLRVIEHLSRVTGLLRCDRAATVWVDEYGPGHVHVHALLDLLADIPRRRFPAEPLRLAWNDGVPGKLDIPDVDRSAAIPLHEAGGSLCAVALGSDGARAWFLIADGMARVPLDRETSGQLLFHAGECAAVVLHRDLANGSTRWSQSGERFAGWPVLRDIEGRESDDGASRRIGGRFLVARVLRGLVDDDLAMDPIALAQQLEGVNRELSHVPGDDIERPLWDDLLLALEKVNLTFVSKAAFALATRVEEQGHVHGARELLELSHRIAVAAASPSEAAESARLIGRLHRRRGEWDEAIRWYEGARAAARVGGQQTIEAIAIDGLASVVRDKGNLPAARQLLQEGLEVARASGDDYPLAAVHHTLMTVEQRAGRLPQAVAHGWRAVNLHRDEYRYFVLVSLAGCLRTMGELDAAEDSYAVVAERVKLPDWRFASLENLAHISALRGHRETFEERAWRADEANWREEATVPVHAQILQYRAKSWEALGEDARARAWYVRARDYAQEHGVNQVYIEVETAIARLDEAGHHDNATVPNPGSRAPAHEPVVETVTGEPGLAATELAEIRGGVGAMRRELAPAFA
jgi:tetratricopeptide (TPR) repeat protein